MRSRWEPGGGVALLVRRQNRRVAKLDQKWPADGEEFLYATDATVAVGVAGAAKAEAALG